jgi:hypothetical protein
VRPTIPVDVIINGLPPKREGKTMEHPAFKNQDIIGKLTTQECMELSNLKEMRQSLTATIDYLEKREGIIFSEARTRINASGAGQ